MSKVYLTQDSENTLRELAILYKPAGANKNKILNAILNYFATSKMTPPWFQEMPVGAIKHKISEELFARCIISALRKGSHELSPQGIVNSIIIHAGTLTGNMNFRGNIRDSLDLESKARCPEPSDLVLDLPMSILRKKQRKMSPKRLGMDIAKLLNRSTEDLPASRLIRMIAGLEDVPRSRKPGSRRIILVRKLDKKVMQRLSELRPVHDSVVKLVNHFNRLKD